MLSKGIHSVNTDPESGAVERSPDASSNISSLWRWVLYAIVAIAVVVGAKHFHVQDLLKEALDWIGKLGRGGR